MAKFKFPIHLPDNIREKFPKFQKNGGKKNWKKLTRKQKGICIGAGIAVILVGGMIIFTMGKGKKASAEASGQRTATVQRMDITSSLSSSGTLSPRILTASLLWFPVKSFLQILRRVIRWRRGRCFM